MKQEIKSNLLPLALFLVAALGLVTWAISGQADIKAYGCDQFGYLRQAELFRHQGYVSGLDTRVRDPEAAELIGIAKEIFIAPADGREIVAPQCHHWDRDADAVILQYPPISGFFLSLLPEPWAGPGLYVALMAVIGACFMWPVIKAGRLSWCAAIAGAGFLAVIYRTLIHYGMIHSVSVPCSIALVAFMAVLSAKLLRSESGLRILVCVVLGLLAGLLAGTRIANGLIVLAVIFLALVMPGGVFNKVKAALAGGVGLLLGLAPLLVSNTINAGSPLHTTYNNIDASAPFFVPIMFYHHGRYYFMDAFSGPLLCTAFIAVIVRLVMLRWQRAPFSAYRLAIAAGLQLLAAFVFFMTHWVRIDYYQVPAACFALFLIFFDLVSQPAGAASPWPKRMGAAALAVLAVIDVARLAMLQPRTYEASAPPAMLKADARVWSDMVTGSIYYYLGKYAAKITFGDDCMQPAMLSAVTAKGHDQYLVVDTDAVKHTVELIAPLVKVEDAGTMRFDGNEYPVKLIPATATWSADTPKTCNKPPW
ncbi:hypothetical protein [Aestuariivirga litoralis]|uniref:hypothetical protein n=1 Tax=Aestuariivirga litoralis TaxID=2650924 RepID=UPI0018C67F0E|nr:hypothetical protein [Aestuariivirga litoralis]MBG1231857.1 hypothetical protein [Aestuariivirga litoralis]